MPIYEYVCQDCGAVSEFLTGIGGQSPDIKCKECGGGQMAQILSPSNFTLNSSARPRGRTCCGREERCDTPPCSTGNSCRRDGK